MIVGVGTTERALTAFAGAELVRETARAVGLSEHVEAFVGVKRRARGLSDAQFVSGLAEAVALGASCLDDLAVARADTAQETMRGFAVPAPQTAGAWLRRFTLGHIRQLDKALEATQRRAFVLAGVDQVTLDFDSTYLFSRSKRRQGVDRTYKKGYALHPLLCFDAASGAAVHARLRRGKAGPSTGMASFLVETLRRVPPGVAVRARLDSGYYGSALFAQMEKAGVTYLCGAPFNPRLLEAVRSVGEGCWAPCADKDEGEVAEFGYRLAHEGASAVTSSSGSPSSRASRPPSRRAAFGTGCLSPTTPPPALPSSSPSTATKPTSSTGCESSNRTSASAPSASTTSWPTGCGSSWSAPPTTCAVGRSSSDSSRAGATELTCERSGSATATSPSQRCSSAAADASSYACPPPGPTGTA